MRLFINRHFLQTRVRYSVYLKKFENLFNKSKEFHSKMVSTRAKNLMLAGMNLMTVVGV